MKSLIVILSLFFSNLVFSQKLPEILTSVNYQVDTVSTEDGELFVTWIVEDDDARGITNEIKRLEKVEVDRSRKDLIFTTYSDDAYEYVIAKEKLFHRTAKFYRITIYSI